MDCPSVGSWIGRQGQQSVVREFLVAAKLLAPEASSTCRKPPRIRPYCVAGFPVSWPPNLFMGHNGCIPREAPTVQQPRHHRPPDWTCRKHMPSKPALAPGKGSEGCHLVRSLGQTGSSCRSARRCQTGWPSVRTVPGGLPTVHGKWH